jgi:hypothetical protein
VTEISSLGITIGNITPFVMFPAAIGGAIAFIAGRPRLAMWLMATALMSMMIPFTLGLISILVEPSSV